MDDSLIYKKKDLEINGEVQTHYYVNHIDSPNAFFNAYTIGSIVNLYPDITTESHSHSFYTLIWFKNGSGIHTIDFDRFQIEPNSIFFIAPLQLHQFENVNNASGYTITFSEEFLLHLDPFILQHIKYSLFRNPINKMQKLSGSSAILENIIKAIISRINSDKLIPNNVSFLAALTSLFLILIENESCKNDNTILTDASYNIYLKFRQLIEDNFKKVHIVGEYVSMMNISLPILTKAVNRYAQASPLQLIHERIILEAKRMLSTTSLRIKEMSAILGFEDSSYFVKFFKRNEHISPVEFRERF